MNKNKALVLTTVLMVVVGLIVSGLGLFYTTDGDAFETTNQYGDVIKMKGTGVYAHDSLFKASILIGTDFVVFFILCPLIILTLIISNRKKSIKADTILVSLIAVMLYYSMNVVFGAHYNNFLLLYIALFSLSFFAFIVSIMRIDKIKLAELTADKFPSKGVYVLLILSGFALFAAWLPDIINGLVMNRPIELIEIYTTEVTYAIDMGIVSPLIFVCIYLLTKKDGLGFVLLQVILSCCGIIGLMIISQTVFHHLAGIVHPIPVIVTKIGMFIVLALFSFYYSFKFMKSIGEEKREPKLAEGGIDIEISLRGREK